MASKSIPGQTKKYGGVVKSVKDTQQQEPRITKEQVIAAFNSFGFQPNERNHNDIGYWTMKGQSEGQQLMEELHKRRMDINNDEDEKRRAEAARERAREDLLNKQKQKEQEISHKESVLKAELAHKQKIAEENMAHQQGLGKVAMPRLSDQDLSALYDEYGLPAPDPEWARNHMPNDPQKVRSVLEMQRKMADDMMKSYSKNTINSMPTVPKPGTMPAIPGQGAPMMGQGGPMGMQSGMIPESSPTTPFFIGDNAIVRITNPTNPQASTLWLVEAKKKVLRPFASEGAFMNAFEDPEAAARSVITISTKELGPGGALEGFTPLQGEQGVNEDGSMEDIPFTEGQLQDRYGKPADPAGENKALSIVDGIMGKMQSQQPEGQPTKEMPISLPQ